MRLVFVATCVAVMVAPGMTPTLSTTVPDERAIALSALRKRGNRACQKDQKGYREYPQTPHSLHLYSLRPGRAARSSHQSHKTMRNHMESVG